jgi:hypothetical protein
MTETATLQPATPDEITQALSFALRYDGRKRVHHADDAMARITADRLVQHLERSGFVLMKRSARAAPTNAEHMPRRPFTEKIFAGRTVGFNLPGCVTSTPLQRDNRRSANSRRPCTTKPAIFRRCRGSSLTMPRRSCGTPQKNGN